MLKFKDVDFRYTGDSENIITDLSFNVKEGELVSIVGASGCGKSTIFRLINGLEKPCKGEILVNGLSVSAIKNYCAYMPQKDLLYPWRTIEENVRLPMEIQKADKRQMSEKSAKILKEVGLYDYRDRFPKDLSGGMKQRVSFARALLAGGELLLLDEPFSALDSLTKISLQQWLLEEWSRLRKTIVFVTHDVEEAIFLSRRIFVIKDQPITYFDEYEIPLDYPRSRDDLKKTEVTELKEKIIKELGGIVKI